MMRSRGMRLVAAVAIVLAISEAPSSSGPARAAAAHDAPEGFGARTRGGEGQPRYYVTSLADAGPGTLRDAVSRGHRYVVFGVAGTIALESPVSVRGAYVTIDASSAPAPGVTLRRAGLTIRGMDGAHDVIVRGLRIRGPVTREAKLKSSYDCLAISRGAFNVLVDHVSISGCPDGAIDIAGNSRAPGAESTRDVTVQWSILADTRKTMLVKYGTTRITLHHNLFVRGLVRLPYVTRERLPADTGLTLDMRNNVVWDWGGGFATAIMSGATANIVNNVYGNPEAAARDRRQAVVVCTDGIQVAEAAGVCDSPARADAYVAGNVSLDGVDLDRAGTVAVPFTAAEVATARACDAAHRVLDMAGAQPRDPFDADYVAFVTLDACSDESPERAHTPRGTRGVAP